MLTTNHTLGMRPVPKPLSDPYRPSHNRVGFTLLELLATLAVAAIILFLVLPAISIPATRSSRINCVINLKNIGLGFRTFAVDHDNRYPWVTIDTNISYRLPPSGQQAEATNNLFALFCTISNELSSPRILRCPSDSPPPATVSHAWSNSYALGPKSAAIPSYFVGLAASEDEPQSLLAGDRNLTIRSAGLDFVTASNYNRISLISSNDIAVPGTNNVGWTAQIHVYAGNVLLGDGSVQRLSEGRLRNQLHDSFPTNNQQFRLFFPALN